MLGYRLEREYVFLDEEDCQREYGLGLKELASQGVKSEELMDERNVPVRGIILRDPSKPFRTLRVYGEFATSMGERLH